MRAKRHAWLFKGYRLVGLQELCPSGNSSEVESRKENNISFGGKQF